MKAIIARTQFRSKAADGAYNRLHGFQWPSSCYGAQGWCHCIARHRNFEEHVPNHSTEDEEKAICVALQALPFSAFDTLS